jgi:hypothetical protein
MDITKKTSTVAPWLRRLAGLTAALALAACSAEMDDQTTDESALDEQAEALIKDDSASAELASKELAPKELASKELAGEGSGEIGDSTQSTLKAAAGGLGFDCTTECGGGGGCCTCYGFWDCIKLGGSGQCKSGTFGCGGDGCMCDWKLLH